MRRSGARSWTGPGGPKMTPIELLRETLAALKDAGVQRAQVKLPDVELSVEFPIELPAPVVEGSAPTPGGWKIPHSLDNPFDLNPGGGQ